MGDFYGLPTGQLSNAVLSLEYLLDAGPRIVRLNYLGGENLLAETPDVSWETENGVFFLRGGHRLWAAPEEPSLTGEPDNDPVEITTLPDGVRLSQPPGPPSGLLRSIEIRLDPLCAQVQLRHILSNRGPRSLKVAPWGITQLRLGGEAYLPQPTNDTPIWRQPNRSLVLWPYTRWDDPRLCLGERLHKIAAQPQGERACKIGFPNPAGWLAYRLDHLLFIKRFTHQPGADYPDLGCNGEVYTDARCLELESLAPLRWLEPGEEASHDETWEIKPIPAQGLTEDLIEKLVSLN